MRKAEFQILREHLSEAPYIIGRDRYINSAVLAPLIMLDGQYHFLFQRRAAAIRQGREVCFPGGLFDAATDKNYADTALRETMEELGIEAGKIMFEGRLGTLIVPLGIAVECFIGRLDIASLSELNPNAGEIEELFLLPVNYFIEHPPETYSVRLEVHPSYINKNGEEIVLLPGKSLGLPDKYHIPWAGRDQRILVYPTEKGVIWGLTAEIINEITRFIAK